MTQGPLKRVHLKYGETSLECLCLRDGSLDVDLTTGVVTSNAKGRRKRMKLSEDKDGYLHIHLNRERKDRRGKPEIGRDRKGNETRRYRIRRYVRVNRLVKMKSIAVGIGGNDWRHYVTDLPRGVDVNHGDLDRKNNHHMNLSLQGELTNRQRRELTPEEAAEIAACTF